jgi:hypothetical protein
LTIARIAFTGHPRCRRLCVLAVGVAVCSIITATAGAGIGESGGQPFRVVIVDHLSRLELGRLAKRGAVGLLVPGVGPTTNRRQALAAMLRGAQLNADLGGVPIGPRLLAASRSPTAPQTSSTIVVALPASGPPVANSRRYPIAVLGPGFHGLLRSVTTRIDGLVSIVDIAPTALGRQRGALTSVRSADPLARLTTLDHQIHSNNRLKLPALIIVACALILLAGVRRQAAIPAILAALVTSIAVGVTQVSSEPLIVCMLLAGTLGGGIALERLCQSDRRMLAAITVVLSLHLLLFVVKPEWVALTPLGPTQNSRFWGVGNQLETLLLAPVLAGALLAGRRYGIAGFVAFSLLTLTLVTDNRLGSDGGGAIVFGIALAFLGMRILRLGVRGFATSLLLAATVVLAIVASNLHTRAPDHLRSAFANGPSSLAAVVENRVPLSYLPALHNWPLTLPLALWFAAALAAALRISDRSARTLVLAVGLAICTSLLVNDSAAYELAGGVAVLAALARFAPPAVPLKVPSPVRVALSRQPVPNEVGPD